MALNMKKMAGRPFSYSYNFKKKGRIIQNFFGNPEWFFYFKGLLSQPLLIYKNSLNNLLLFSVVVEVLVVLFTIKLTLRFTNDQGRN